jgi:hypothetical protein
MSREELDDERRRVGERCGPEDMAGQVVNVRGAE